MGGEFYAERALTNISQTYSEFCDIIKPCYDDIVCSAAFECMELYSVINYDGQYHKNLKLTEVMIDAL